MKRYLLLIPVCLINAVVWAYDPVPAPEHERADRLQRNRALIEAMVDGSITLADESAPLNRAGACANLAGRLADELQQAATDRDVPRVAQLGRHLQEMLEGGVAHNLKQARPTIPAGSSDERKLYELASQTVQRITPLEEGLQRAVLTDAQPEMKKALEGLQDGRSQVERSVRPAAKPKDRVKGS
jgi:hypothetical protein